MGIEGREGEKTTQLRQISETKPLTKRTRPVERKKGGVKGKKQK